MRKLSEILRAAKERISTPKKWCKRVPARNGRGEPTNADDPKACRYCAITAVEVVLQDQATQVLKLSEMFACFDLLEEALPGDLNDVPDYNDDPKTTHKKIMHLYDRAIELAESRGL